MAIVLLAVTSAFSQSPSPGIFNYQGVARNSVGNVLINRTITLRLTVHDGAAAGPTVYQESRTAITNPFGLFNVQVGSAGFISQVGTIAGVNWGVGNKYIQVEIDPNGGTSFINIGTAQIASVPYSLYSSLSNDLVLPFIKTQAATGSTLIGITNSATTGTQGALMGTSASTDGNAYAITGTISSVSPGGFSSGVRGINNGTGGLGIGVYGSQNGSGWGVYGTTPSGIGVNGSSSSGVGGFFSTSSGFALITNGGNAGISNLSPAYRLDVDATTGGSNGVRVRNTASFATVDIMGSGNDQALRFGKAGALWSGINTLPDGDHINFFKFGAGDRMALNVNTGNLGVGGNPINAVAKVHARGFNVANNLYSSSTGFLGATGVGVNDITAQATNEKWGIHTFVNGAVGTQHAIFAEPGTTAAINIGLFGRVSTAPAGGQSFGLFAFDPINNASTWAATIRGRLQYQDGTQALNNILQSDANGNASWNSLSGLGIVSGTGTTQFIPIWTTPTTIGNSLLFDNGTSIGLGTVTPTHRFTVSHGGSTGIGVNSTSGFSVVDINAASGDAALRFYNAGAGQWNMRNRPADNYLEIFELGGGGSRVVIQDGTGNVGIGATVAPSYKLDVEHGGSTGIRSLSTGSFSVVDIDAFSGDAALRFQKQGTGMWNTRNRPADDYYEIFELGGGGSRVVIQDGTGNFGIGETTAPSYKLDVLHGGSTGARIRSSASFSVVDIDAQSGDAALRFVKAGVNQWNIRNRPADDYLEIFELGGGGSRVVIQDGTGNVGIGQTVAPSYKLDVLHGGSTGLRVQSSASFSVVDIDANSGDAALRFVKAGVNQWNTRNRPADDYYEIFELGGGGSRFVIQDGTGNVGIGQTTSPSYKLDVLHGGATGIRVQSSATFSVVDIDGASGDAALRFANAGVNQWNIRNNPANDDLQFFELGGGGERMRIENTTGNVVIPGNFTVGGVKAFTMDHPLDPANKLLKHAAAESNEVINFYSGNVTTDASGKAVVRLPDYYEALNKDSRYQLTVIGSFAQAIISKEVSNNQFEIATNQPNVKVSWEVKGVRNDAHMKMHPFVAEVEKTGAQKGKYWDAAAHNQPASKGVSYDANLESSLNYTAPVNANKTAPATTGGSLDQQAIVPPATKTIDNSGSVANAEATKVTVKPVDNSGSIMQTEINKPATKKLDNSGSVSETEIQKPVIKTQEPKVDKTIEPVKQVKENLPAVLKGTSMDPDAKPVMQQTEKTTPVVAPQQNSSNTAPQEAKQQATKTN